MPSQNHLSLDISYPLVGSPGLHADLGYGKYMLSSLWRAGVRAGGYNYPVSGSSLEYVHISLYGEWLYRVAATRGRTLNLYAGGGAFIGYEAYDPRKGLDPWIDTGLGSGAFLYGVHARTEAEVFFTRRAALVVSLTIPLNFSSPLGWFHCQTGLGLRYDL